MSLSLLAVLKTSRGQSLFVQHQVVGVDDLFRDLLHRFGEAQLTA